MINRANFKHSITALFLILVVGVMPVNASASSLKIGGTGAALGGMQLLLDAFVEENTEVEGVVLPSLGSGGGIKALTNGAIDIAVSSRQLKPMEREAGAEAYFYAKTAIVLATPKKNKTAGLSSSEFVDIVNGKNTKWEDGSDIRMVLRPESETDVKLLKELIPEIVSGWDALGKIPGIPVGYTDQMTADMIQLMPGGLGISTLALIESEQRPLTPLVLDGIEPSLKTVGDSSYPLIRSFYFVVPVESNEITKKFVKFLQSDAGTEILRNAGHYIPPRQGE